jgi:hypothetical protein
MKQESRRKLSLSPLSFGEAVSDLLKVKPEPKKRKPKAKRRKVASLRNG